MDDNNPQAASPEDEEAEFAKVPADFPRPPSTGAIGGAQTKFLATKYKGRFYSPGCTPPELYERWMLCEDLAAQLSEKSLESKAGKRAHMSEVEILDQYLPRLIATKWTSEAEARWVMRRVADKLGWPVPRAAAGP